MKTIAVVDDDIFIGNMLEEVLTKEGYHVLRAYSGTEAVLLLSSNQPDLVLLDLMLPGLNGSEVLVHIRNIPVIIISAKVDIHDKVKLLLQGAADYMTKPFDIQELLARITVQLRKQNLPAAARTLEYKEIRLDLTTYQVFVNQTEIHLTKTEYAILKQLLQNPNQVITKSQILDAISEDTPDCVENSLKVHISNLRKKLRTVQKKDYIESVWGIGFKLNAD
ncbi:Response regulator ArlR [uncultured Roseburia sp.]|uniref:Stage 0 sporulation protein A homolog n=1 Tax=Brotonthovivens ammoniilytica TaxID=2981725 RepID=A0ABT2TG34_9FIRM|nr:response regulator transcription factor [Brotonthovivens ammoniilytica]MCU6761150.1 response regulator transcription factor [Brotonthovivens ammoniilytica]SCI20384.1 Response regulator ArlR [uncultured Roseburia sp.]